VEVAETDAGLLQQAFDVGDGMRVLFLFRGRGR